MISAGGISLGNFTMQAFAVVYRAKSVLQSALITYSALSKLVCLDVRHVLTSIITHLFPRQ